MRRGRRSDSCRRKRHRGSHGRDHDHGKNNPFPSKRPPAPTDIEPFSYSRFFRARIPFHGESCPKEPRIRELRRQNSAGTGSVQLRSFAKIRCSVPGQAVLKSPGAGIFPRPIFGHERSEALIYPGNLRALLLLTLANKFCATHLAKLMRKAAAGCT